MACLSDVIYTVLLLTTVFLISPTNAFLRNRRGLPVPPDTFKCVSHNFEEMICDWCPPEKIEGTTYIWKLYWTSSNPLGNTQGECLKYNYIKLTYNCKCRLCGTIYGEYCTKETIQFRPFQYFNFTVLTSTSRTNGIPTNFFLFTDTNILKPSSVRRLSAKALNSTSIRVEWEEPLNLTQYGSSLVYNVSCYSEWGSFEISTEATMAELGGLHPYTDYTINVTSKPIEGGYCSESKGVLLSTPEDIPAAGPKVAGFRQLQCFPNNTCLVSLCWKPVPRSEMNGLVTSYKMNVTNKQTGNVITLSAGRGVYSKNLLLHKDTTYNVQMTVNNRAGQSAASNFDFFIATENVQPRDIIAETSEDDKWIHFSWSPPMDFPGPASNYTLFQCEGLNGDCSGEPNMIEVPGYTNFISLPYSGDRFLYGLSANRPSGNTGMARHWICVYRYSGEPGKPRLHLDKGQQTERSFLVNIEKPTCNSYHSGQVEFYQIVCARTDRSSKDISWESNITIPGNTSQYTIEKLSPYTEYRLYLEAFSRHSEASYSESTRYRTLESAPDDPPQNVSIVEVNSSHVTVTWDPPSTPNGRILQYTILVKNGSTAVMTRIFNSSVFRGTLTDLQPCVYYTFQMTARNSAGTSGQSPAIPVQTRTGRLPLNGDGNEDCPESQSHYIPLTAYENSALTDGEIIGIVMGAIALVIGIIICIAVYIHHLIHKEIAISVPEPVKETSTFHLYCSFSGDNG